MAVPPCTRARNINLGGRAEASALSGRALDVGTNTLETSGACGLS